MVGGMGRSISVSRRLLLKLPVDVNAPRPVSRSYGYKPHTPRASEPHSVSSSAKSRQRRLEVRALIVLAIGDVSNAATRTCPKHRAD